MDLPGLSRGAEAACRNEELSLSSEQVKWVEVLADGNLQIAF
jgi:hypothetical protein